MSSIALHTVALNNPSNESWNARIHVGGSPFSRIPSNKSDNLDWIVTVLLHWTLIHSDRFTLQLKVHSPEWIKQKKCRFLCVLKFILRLYSIEFNLQPVCTRINAESQMKAKYLFFILIENWLQLYCCGLECGCYLKSGGLIIALSWSHPFLVRNISLAAMTDSLFGLQIFQTFYAMTHNFDENWQPQRKFDWSLFVNSKMSQSTSIRYIWAE